MTQIKMTQRGDNVCCSHEPSVNVDDLDVVFFIDAVKRRREIWDIKSEDYKDRLKKQIAWQEVCECVLEDFCDKTDHEQNTIVKKLALKWKNIKDNYSRCQRKRTKTGSARQYLYGKHLAFLEESIGDSPLPKQEEQEDPLALPNERATPAARSGASRAAPKQRREVEFVNSPFVMEPPDEDKAFFDSLIPAIRNFSEDEKLDFRSEVLDVVRKIKRSRLKHKPD